MRFFKRDKPKIKVETQKKDSYSGWLKCSHCHELIHEGEIEKNLHCCPKCNHHYRISAKARIALLTDEGTFSELFAEIETSDPLKFTDEKTYTSRIQAAKEKSGSTEAIVTGTAKIHDQEVAIGAMNFEFMGGSMGSVVGEKLTRLIEHAVEERLPLVTVSISGGARMQESIHSLMQMAKTSAALTRLDNARLPFISILADPTAGGVTASFATLGDLIIAEPGALICFAGPRVIEQVIKQKLPEGAQKAEFLLEHGMIDCIVKRHDLKNKVANFLTYLVRSKETKKTDKTKSGLPTQNELETTLQS